MNCRRQLDLLEFIGLLMNGLFQGVSGRNFNCIIYNITHINNDFKE